jgi:hypothetical protein
MQVICMKRHMADHTKAHVFGAWPLKPGRELSARSTGLTGGLVERLLKGVVDEDVFDGALAEPGLNQAPLACGVEVAGVKASVRAGRSAAHLEVPDVHIAARLMASVLIKWPSMRTAGIADLDAWGIRIRIAEHIKGVQQLVGGVLRHVGAGALADDETWVRGDGDSVHE